MSVVEEQETRGPRLKRPPTFDRLAKKRPIEKTIHVILDDEVLDVAEKARSAFADAKKDDGPEEITLAEERLREAEEDLEDATVELRFRSIGRKAYDDLIDKHPATTEQKKEAKSQGTEAPYNPESFPQALVTASLVEPELTLDQVETLFNEWNNGEVMSLWLTALEVNTTRRVGDLGKDFSQILN